MSVAAAFVAGIVSFLSPCVLPLIPGYLSFITGFTPAQLTQDKVGVKPVLVPSVLFVAGFSLVFVGLGASASVLGGFLSAYREMLIQLSGVLVFVLGFFMLGVIKVPWLYGEARFEMGKARSFGRAAALIMGAAFAFGWTPCVGPILGSILALAGSTGSVAKGALLLLVYSLGLGLPFIATALLFGKMRSTLSWLNRHSLTINRIAGALLMTVGVLIFSGQLSRLAGWLTVVLPAIEL